MPNDRQDHDCGLGPQVPPPSDDSALERLMSRRSLLRVGAAGAAAFGLGVGRLTVEPSLARRGFASPDGVFGATSMALADALYTEAFPTSPLIVNPFRDPLPVPRALTPVPRSVWTAWPNPPSKNQQSTDPSGRAVGKHQIWPTDIAGLPNTLPQPTAPEPIVYTVDLKVDAHSRSEEHTS